MFLGFLWLYCIILTSVYSSNLTAFLTVRRRPQSIQTIKELYHSDVRVGGVSFFQTVLAASLDYMTQSFATEYVREDDEELMFERVSSGELTYLENRLYLEYKVATRPEAQPGYRGYNIMEECLNPFSIAMGVRKHSPLRRKFDTVLGWLVQSGLVRKWFLDSLEIQTKQIPPKAQKELTPEADPTTSTTGQTAMSVSHLQGGFFILGFGYALAFSVLLFETALRAWWDGPERPSGSA